ncbi:ankyrin repeat and MYND domain-containing protein 1 isoform X2 [Octodon degus]|uniref:Ankyrin repeat and MYND domain-containing protein 1 isoform X2 n=1 Tax=Octodon degus TaxID=10160 RepID=A0A6P6F0C0_OCTDE|nr:ankyrin repeat and MYND domain-containing protein 1 isoform X2 [Octodon degus]
MERDRSSASLDYSSRGRVEEQDGQPSAVEDPGHPDSYSLVTAREGPVSLEEEVEETEGPLSELHLKVAPIQLVRGVQTWPDGSVYQGEFGLNVKMGYGEFSWPTGEAYCGQFYRDHCHGLGTYTWPDGCSFTGTFYLSQREGYGSMNLKTRLFQGLYKADVRFGPGVETYPDGSQDVGLWFREHLIKLATEMPGSFSMLSYPEFSAFLTCSRERISLPDQQTMEWGPPEDQDPFFYEYKRFLLNDNLTLPLEMQVYSTDSCHLPMTSSLRRELDAQIFMDDIPPFVDDEEPWFITNETPLLVKIQKQAYKFRNKEAHTSWKMGAILEGNRTGFGRTGPKEQFSQEMILKAEQGAYDWICGILKDRLACADVADSKGYTVLAAAAVHCHNDIVSLLLDHGANVNKFTDEGLTPLNMCLLLYYPSGSFKPNVAERTVPQEKPKQLLILKPSCSGVEMTVGSTYEAVELAPSSREQKLLPSPPGSQEDGLALGAPQSLESSSPSAQGALSDREKGPEDASGGLDVSPLCSETHFASNLCVHNYSIQLSRGMLEKSAQAYSTLQAPTIPDKGTVRGMAWSMVEHRCRWLTIKLLLHRGADPNLCCVPMRALFFAVKAGDVDGVQLLLESGARTDIRYPPQLGALTPLHIAAALPGEEGVRITELLLHAITDVDAQAADQDEAYKPDKLELLPSSLKLSNEPGPPSSYYTTSMRVAEEGGRTALHVACEREDSNKCARDVVQLLLSHGADPNLLWSGHSPLSLSIASGNDLIVKELLSCGADPNLPLTRGLGSALCVVCDLAYEQRRSTDNKITLGDRMAVGTAVDYGYFQFFQDRKIAHCPFHSLLPAERETFLARKRLLEHMGLQLRHAVLAKEQEWDRKALAHSRKVELCPSQRMKKRSSGLAKAPDTEGQELMPFFKFCYQCGRSIGVRLTPCARCYGILTCSKFCKSKAWVEFHKKDCSEVMGMPGRQKTGAGPRGQEGYWGRAGLPLTHAGSRPGLSSWAACRLCCSWATGLLAHGMVWVGLCIEHYSPALLLGSGLDLRLGEGRQGLPHSLLWVDARSHLWPQPGLCMPAVPLGLSSGEGNILTQAPCTGDLGMAAFLGLQGGAAVDSQLSRAMGLLSWMKGLGGAENKV